METPQHVQDAIDAFAKDLGREDEMGSVVRAHIRIENLLVELVEGMVPKPTQLKRLNLEYDGYVSLALALGLEDERGPALRAMGSLRNRFAHKLDTALDLSTVKGLYDALAPRDKEQVQASFGRIRSQHDAVQVAKNYASLSPKDQFQLIALIIWLSLKSKVLIMRGEARAGA